MKVLPLNTQSSSGMAMMCTLQQTESTAVILSEPQSARSSSVAAAASQRYVLNARCVFPSAATVEQEIASITPTTETIHGLSKYYANLTFYPRLQANVSQHLPVHQHQNPHSGFWCRLEARTRTESHLEELRGRIE